MTRSQSDLFLTTNQDYGSFYSGRLQHSHINPDAIALELSLNDQVRNERRQLPAIAYEIMFDKHDSLKIVTHRKKQSKPIISRRQLKYIKSRNKTDEQRQITVQNALKYYTTFIECIYKNKPEKNPQLSTTALELIANELFLLNSDISADELAENMVAITVPREYLGMLVINPDQPYPGTESDCAKPPALQHLLDRFRIVQQTVVDVKENFDSQSLHCQSLEGIRYIYNSFNTVIPSYRI